MNNSGFGIWYHHTPDPNAQKIIETGFKPPRIGCHGRGIYLTSADHTRFPDAVGLEVEVLTCDVSYLLDVPRDPNYTSAGWLRPPVEDAAREGFAAALVPSTGNMGIRENELWLIVFDSHDVKGIRVIP